MSCTQTDCRMLAGSCIYKLDGDYWQTCANLPDSDCRPSESYCYCLDMLPPTRSPVQGSEKWCSRDQPRGSQLITNNYFQSVTKSKDISVRSADNPPIITSPIFILVWPLREEDVNLGKNSCFKYALLLSHLFTELRAFVVPVLEYIYSEGFDKLAAAFASNIKYISMHIWKMFFWPLFVCICCERVFISVCALWFSNNSPAIWADEIKQYGWILQGYGKWWSRLCVSW